jgi:hypothetical protein
MAAPAGKTFAGWSLGGSEQIYQAGDSYTVLEYAYFTAQWQVPVPSAPVDVTAEALSSSSISVSWAAVNGADSYKVYYGSGHDDSFTNSIGGVITATSYTDTSCDPETTRYYKVSAVNSAGESGKSSVVFAATLQLSAPSVPTNLAASAQSSSSIRISWNASSSGETPTYYNIWRSSSGSGVYTEIGKVSGTTLSYTNTGLSASTTYYYKVDAQNSAGRSAQSLYTYAATQSSGGPVTYAPFVQSLSGTKSGATNLVISWSFATGSGYGTPTSIRFRVRNPDGGSVAELETLSGSAHSYTFNYLPWVDSNGEVWLGIVGTNTAGSGSGGIVYYTKTNRWSPRF